MSKTAKIIIALLIVVAAAVGLYFWHKGKQKPAPAPVTVPDPAVKGNEKVSDLSNGLDPDLAVNQTVRDLNGLI